MQVRINRGTASILGFVCIDFFLISLDMENTGALECVILFCC